MAEEKGEIGGDGVPKKKGRGRPSSAFSDHPFHVCCSRPKQKGMFSSNWDTGEAAEFFKSFIDGDHRAESMECRENGFLQLVVDACNTIPDLDERVTFETIREIRRLKETTDEVAAVTFGTNFDFGSPGFDVGVLTELAARSSGLLNCKV